MSNVLAVERLVIGDRNAARVRFTSGFHMRKKLLRSKLPANLPQSGNSLYCFDFWTVQPMFAGWRNLILGVASRSHFALDTFL
jgi:hypothetical protein